MFQIARGGVGQLIAGQYLSNKLTLRHTKSSESFFFFFGCLKVEHLIFNACFICTNKED